MVLLDLSYQRVGVGVELLLIMLLFLLIIIVYIDAPATDSSRKWEKETGNTLLVLE